MLKTVTLSATNSIELKKRLYEKRRQRELELAAELAAEEKEVLLKELEEKDEEIRQINLGNVSTLFGKDLSQSTKSIISAPTQVGKTDAILRLCQESIENDVPLIITTPGQMERKILRAEYNGRMKQLIDDWYGKSTIIGKIFAFVYESEIGVSETELKELIKECGVAETWYNDLCYDNKYKNVFERTSNDITKLKKEALEYTRTK